jgi:ubiquitin C-terminal hydrolase
MLDAAKWLKWGTTDASFPTYNRSAAVVSSRSSKSSEMVDSVGTGSRTGTFAGLLNRGNKCYQNAFLQALRVSDDYRALLLDRTKASLSDTAQSASTTASNVTAGLGLVLSRLDTSPHVVVDPFPLIRALPAQFSGTSQEDAAEFGRFLIDQVHEHFRRTMPSVGSSSSASVAEAANPVERALQLVDPSFGGVFQSVIKCQTCQFKSISHDPFTELSLSFESNIATTVPQLLQRFLADENLTGADAFLCLQCQTKQPATRYTRLIHSPAHLIVCLKQFEFNMQTMTRSKLSVPVAFDQVLDVPIISTDGIPSSARYSLYAEVIHSGTSALHGHYYSFGRHSNANIAPWFLFNDSSVTSTSFEAIQQLSLNFRNDVPYLLFYHRL